MTGDRVVIEGALNAGAMQDHGQAMICEIDDPILTGGAAGDTDEAGFFVRLHSWSETGDHATLDRFRGRRVRVTVEILD